MKPACRRPTVEELREKLRRVEETAAICIARSDDPKDKAGHARWRDQKVAELKAAIAAAEGRKP